MTAMKNKSTAEYDGVVHSVWRMPAYGTPDRWEPRCTPANITLPVTKTTWKSNSGITCFYCLYEIQTHGI